MDYGSPSKKPLIPAHHRSSAERCKLEWSIVNFHGFYNHGGTLESNSFAASCTTFTSNSVWRLKIYPKHVDKSTEYVTFALERCHSDSDKESCPTVTAHVRLGVCCDSGEISFKRSYINHFCEGDIRKFDPLIERRELIENKRKFMPDDILTVHCELDIYTDECRKLFDGIYTNSPPELKELSNNMKEFFHAERNADINMRKDDAHVKCHKAILSSRSQTLASLVKDFEGDAMELGNIHKDAVARFFEYIYSGDLSPLFTQANLLSELLEAAKSYQLSDLESFLEPEIVNCRSIVPAYKYKFDWKIANFSKVQGCGDVEFDGPTTKWFAVGEAEWKVSLSIRNSPTERGLAPVSVNLKRITETQISHQVLFEVALLTVKSEFVYCKIAEFIFHEDGQREVHITYRDEILRYHQVLLYQDTLTVFCSFVVSSPSVENTTEESEFHIVCDLADKEDSDLRQLSSDFENLFDLDQFKDMTINVSDGELKVHQCIIDARCRCLITDETLRNRLAEMPTEIVESFLKFLYSGKRQHLRKHALQFYLLANDLNLEELQQRYRTRLSWILSSENVLNVIQEAHRVDDRALKSQALIFIKKAAGVVLNSEQFQNLKTTSTALAEEIVSFVDSNE